MILTLTAFGVGVAPDGSVYQWDVDAARWKPHEEAAGWHFHELGHYPNGAGGWVDRCHAHGYDIEALTELFLVEVRMRVPPALADAICGAPVVGESMLKFKDYVKIGVGGRHNPKSDKRRNQT